MHFSLTVSAKRVTLFLAFVAVLLAVQSISGKYIQAAAGDDSPALLDDLVTLFNINREQSVPTWYVSAVLLLCGMALGLIARVHWFRRASYRFHWIGLSLIFVYLSLDEAAAIHEFLTDPLGEALDTTGPLYFAWVIVGAALLGLFGLAYFRFWLRLPERTRRLFAIAGAVYVGGGLGVELIGSNLWYLEGGSSLAYSTVGTVEELMEMLGAVLFFYALLGYIAEYVGEIQVVVRDRHAQPAPHPGEAPAATPAPARNRPMPGETTTARGGLPVAEP